MPSEVRLGTSQHQQVALALARRAQLELRPFERLQRAVQDVQRGAPGTVVEERIRVEGGHHSTGIPEQLPSGKRPGVASIDPAVEGGNQDRTVERDRLDHAEEGHAPRIRRT